MNEILGGDFIDNFVFFGLSGGILLAVHSGHYSISPSEAGVHTLPLVGWPGPSPLFMAHKGTRKSFLGELRWVSLSVMDKWLVLSDFNMILQAADKKNANLNRRLMDAFRDLVRDLEFKLQRAFLAGQEVYMVQ